MIVCDNCNEVISKVAFCSSKCRVQAHRKKGAKEKEKVEEFIDKIEQKIVVNPNVEPRDKIPAIGRCQPPNGQCRMMGQLYHVEYYGTDGLVKKDLFLCTNHHAIAKNQCEKVESAL